MRARLGSSPQIDVGTDDYVGSMHSLRDLHEYVSLNDAFNGTNVMSSEQLLNEMHFLFVTHKGSRKVVQGMCVNFISLTE